MSSIRRRLFPDHLPRILPLPPLKMKVRVKESTIICPAEHTPKRRLWISNLDIVMRRAHNHLVYYYKPNGSANFFDPQMLKEALRKLLVPFYPIAGRLARDGNGRIEINCNAEGVLFVEAEADFVMDDLGDFVSTSEKIQLVTEIDYSADISSYPLVMFQLTFFKCGGVCIGMGIHHTVVDGMSCFNFFNSWAQITRGITISVTPLIHRMRLAARVPPTPMFHHVEYDQPPPLITPQIRQLQSSPLPTFSNRVLKITLDQLNTLKSKARRHDKMNKYSTYAILTAHIWRCLCKARGLSNDQPTSLYIATDGRSRLNPPVSEYYFGNVIFTTSVTSLVGEIQSEPLVHTIEKIHEAVKRRDNEYLRSALDYLETQPDPTALVRGGHMCKSPNLTVANWMRMPIHEADFGWGGPIYMGPAKIENEGRVLIMRNPTNDGSLSVVLRLETHQMQLFQKFLYDFDLMDNHRVSPRM